MRKRWIVSMLVGVGLALFLVPVALADVTEFPLPHAESRPYTIVAGPDGNLWFTESMRGTIGRISRRARSRSFRSSGRTAGRTGSRSARTATCGSPSVSATRSERSRRRAKSPSTRSRLRTRSPGTSRLFPTAISGSPRRTSIRSAASRRTGRSMSTRAGSASFRRSSQPGRTETSGSPRRSGTTSFGSIPATPPTRRKFRSPPSRRFPGTSARGLTATSGSRSSRAGTSGRSRRRERSRSIRSRATSGSPGSLRARPGTACGSPRTTRATWGRSRSTASWATSSLPASIRSGSPRGRTGTCGTASGSATRSGV